MNKGKIIVFTCNWSAYRGLEEVGRNKAALDADVLPVRIPCLGRISPGIILRAFEKGARGVLLLGCMDGECHHEFGGRHAIRIAGLSGDLIRTLGYGSDCLDIGHVGSARPEAWLEKVETFVEKLSVTS